MLLCHVLSYIKMTWKLKNRIKSLLLIFMTVTKANGKLDGIQRRVKMIRVLEYYVFNYLQKAVAN